MRILLVLLVSAYAYADGAKMRVGFIQKDRVSQYEETRYFPDFFPARTELLKVIGNAPGLIRVSASTAGGLLVVTETQINADRMWETMANAGCTSSDERYSYFHYTIQKLPPVKAAAEKAPNPTKVTHSVAPIAGRLAQLPDKTIILEVGSSRYEVYAPESLHRALAELANKKVMVTVSNYEWQDQASLKVIVFFAIPKIVEEPKATPVANTPVRIPTPPRTEEEKPDNRRVETDVPFTRSTVEDPEVVEMRARTRALESQNARFWKAAKERELSNHNK